MRDDELAQTGQLRPRTRDGATLGLVGVDLVDTLLQRLAGSKCRTGRGQRGMVAREVGFADRLESSERHVDPFGRVQQAREAPGSKCKILGRLRGLCLEPRGKIASGPDRNRSEEHTLKLQYKVRDAY